MEVGFVEEYKSVIMYFLLQVRFGMDFIKVVFLMFIFERRFFLEMYVDFFVYLDLFVSISDQKDFKD